MWLAVFNHFLHLPQFWQVSAWSFHCLKSSSVASNQNFFGWPRLLFPSTSKSKICPVYNSLHFTYLKQHSLSHLNNESRLSVSINLGGDLCWQLVLSWCFTTIIALLFHYAPNVSYIPFWGPSILMNKASSLWNSCYTFGQLFYLLHLKPGSSTCSNWDIRTVFVYLKQTSTSEDWCFFRHLSCMLHKDVYQKYAMYGDFYPIL